MVTLSAGWTPDDYTQFNTTYVTDYGRWNDFLMRNAVMLQIVDMRAASVIKSYSVTGKNKTKLEKLLLRMRGRGKETFQMIMQNLYKVCYICGDSYALLVTEDGDAVKAGEAPADLIILASDNVRQVIKNGRIIRYEEINGETPHTWQPFQVLHIRYNPRGASTHGMSAIEPQQNNLIEYEQMLQLGSEMYRKTTNPKQIIMVNTDNEAKLQTIRDAIKATGDTWGGILVLPKGLVEPDDIKDITLSPTLKPGEWLNVLKAEMFHSTATSEIILGGSGYSTGTEDALMKTAGYVGSIRDSQEMLEQNFRVQFIAQVFPDEDDDTNVEFSYALEREDEKYNRNLQSIPIFANLLQAINPETGQPLIKPESIFELIEETLDEMGKSE